MKTTQRIALICLAACGLLAAWFPHAAPVMAGAEFFLLDMQGKVRLHQPDGTPLARSAGSALPPGTLVQTMEDGELVFAGGSRFYHVHRSSSVRVEGTPDLIQGTLSSSSSLQFPRLRLEEAGPFAQGRTARVVLSTPETDPAITARIHGKNGERELTLFPVSGGVYRALTGFDVAAVPGEYLLEAELMSREGAVTRLAVPVLLREEAWKKGVVYLPPGKGTLFEPSERKERERRELRRILTRISSRPLWTGPFSYPVPDPVVISEFGKKRTYYVGGTLHAVSYHRGIDLRAATGQNVYACGAGVVVFAGFRLTSGNTVVLDHGQGVFSVYLHLDGIAEETGREVEREQKIGTAGATGLASGPHLHWGVMVDGVYVDPEDWVRDAYKWVGGGT
ncbi:MAG: peptidoglycan DD-metalloendopeptidase family protein [Spirochaetota bacterium]